jgi:predicted phosphodiesterase
VLLRQQVKNTTIYVIVIVVVIATASLAYASVMSESLIPRVTVPVPSEPKPIFNFAAAGDFECNGNANQTVANIAASDPEVVLGLGDYSYEYSHDCWTEMMQPIIHKTKIVLGNHENLPWADPVQYLELFNMTNHYYSFDHENVHFLAMASSHKSGPTSEQFAFIQQDLAKASQDNDTDWIVAFLHSPLYGTSKTIPEEVGLRNIYQPLFDQYDVDLVLQGHIHNYQRSHPLKFNATMDEGGTVFVTAGTAGAFEMNFAQEHDYIAEKFKAVGFVYVDVHEDKLEMAFIASNGTRIDPYTIYSQ